MTRFTFACPAIADVPVAPQVGYRLLPIMAGCLAVEARRRRKKRRLANGRTGANGRSIGTCMPSRRRMSGPVAWGPPASER